MTVEKTDIKVLSETDNIRLYVIEHTLNIETLISKAIGSLLGVDYESSKSFGFGSSALSFSQKVQIIQDINGLESDMSKKLTCLMNIRNKFAHVQTVNSFDKLFEVAKNGTQIKNQLEGWFKLEDKKDDDEKYKFLFFKLAQEITEMLFNLEVELRLKKNVLQIEKDFQKGQLEAYKDVVDESTDGEKLSAKVHSKIVEKLPHLRIEKKK